MMTATRTTRHGLGVVEVLVAVGILAVNVIGWSALLMLAVSLVRRIGEIGEGPGASLSASAECGLNFIVPFVGSRCRLGGVRRGHVVDTPVRRRRAGFTIVEVLVAAAIGAVILGSVVALTGTSSRASRAVRASADSHVVRAGVPLLVTNIVEVAGRGLDQGCGLAAVVGDDRVVVRRVLTDGAVVEEELFAARDGGGRPALYLRRVPHARQPWVEDVTGFVVQRIEVESSAAQPARVASIVVRVTHMLLDDPLTIDVALPHRPCLEAPP